MTAPDVVVVGAGVEGLASAWRLAQRGASVMVIDPSPGSGASGVAAGMLAPVTEARLGEEDLLRLSLASAQRWQAFAAEVEDASARRIGFRDGPTVMVALDADDRALLGEVVAQQRALGLPVTDVRGRGLRDLEPGLGAGVRVGAVADGERSVDPPAVVGALVVAAERAGVVLRRDRVVRIEVAANGAARAVVLEGGERLAAASLVLAAGSWSGQVAGLPESVRPPIRPVKGEVLTLRPPVGVPSLSHTIRGYVRGFTVYVVPRDDGRLVVGATSRERGWDVTVTAGGVYELLRDALTLLPALEDAELVGANAGLRPATPDDLPLIGRSAVDGLVLATGHYRNGVLLAPITAEAVAAVVASEPVPAEVEPCDPQRFTAPAAAGRTAHTSPHQDEVVRT